MESWNDGIVGFQRKLSILNFSVKMNFAIYPILQYPKPIFPLFQHSIVPPGAQAQRAGGQLGRNPQLAENANWLWQIPPAVDRPTGVHRGKIGLDLIGVLQSSINDRNASGHVGCQLHIMRHHNQGHR
jgi:hypothetical protein